MKQKFSGIVRITVLAFALLNQLLVLFGYPVLPIEEGELEQAISVIFTILAALWNLLAERKA